jgi:hypothetical protein
MEGWMERVKRLTINREGIGFFKAILDSYEEVCLMTVLDGKTGEIELTYPASAEEDLIAIMEDMKRFDIAFVEATDVR